MRLKVVKTEAGQPDYITTQQLVEEASRVVLAMLPSFDGYVKQKEVVELLERSLNEDSIVKAISHEGTFNLGMPVNIANVQACEKDGKEGDLYYDIVNKRLRLCTNKGWVTK